MNRQLTREKAVKIFGQAAIEEVERLRSDGESFFSTRLAAANSEGYSGVSVHYRPDSNSDISVWPPADMRITHYEVYY